jgi:hypothetical protein
MSDSGLKYNGPINPNPGPGESSIIIYSYVPSLALGVVGVITFTLIFLVNLYYLIKKRGQGYRAFHILLCVGAVRQSIRGRRGRKADRVQAMEIGGYGARIASHYRPFLVSAFIAQYFLIVVVSPSLSMKILWTDSNS